MNEHDAGTDFIHERRIRSDDRIIGSRPAWHILLREVIVALERKLAAEQYYHFRRVFVVRAGTCTDTEPIERIFLGKKYRFALQHILIHCPAGAPALDDV